MGGVARICLHPDSRTDSSSIQLSHRSSLIERAQTTLRDVVGSRTLQSVISDRTEVARQVEEIVEGVAEKWGVSIESILIKDIIFSRELQESLSSAATQRRIGESKVIAARAEVDAARLMRQVRCRQHPHGLCVCVLHCLPGCSCPFPQPGCRHPRQSCCYADPSAREPAGHGQDQRSQGEPATEGERMPFTAFCDMTMTIPDFIYCPSASALCLSSLPPVQVIFVPMGLTDMAAAQKVTQNSADGVAGASGSGGGMTAEDVTRLNQMSNM